MPTVAVLRVLLDGQEQPAWGLAICRQAGLGSGTVYPILARLQARGWAVSAVETGPHPGRPARTYWALTDAGRVEATAALGKRRARLGA
jgi:DNA-binding PadR family transcriptional regulator